MSVILILQVFLSLLGLSAQGLHLQHQDLPLSAQHQQLSLGAFCLVGGTDESVKKKKKKKKMQGNQRIKLQMQWFSAAHHKSSLALI